MANQVTARFGAKDNLSPELDKITAKFEKLKKAATTGQGRAGLVGGVVAGVTVAGVNAATAAVSELTDVLEGSVQAAIKDQESQARLGASLRANLPAWNGDTRAIEDHIKAQMDLGFTDEEQRDSLARLVAATHDVTSALKIQRTAMDLARFKGVSLADATEALTKVEGGQYRALKSLGIVLKDGATAQDALNAVQKVANGQADAYAQTAGGKMLVAQTKINEAMEKLGYVVLPAVADAASAVADAVDGISKSFDDLDKALAPAGGLGGAWDELWANITGGPVAMAAAFQRNGQKAQDAQRDLMSSTKDMDQSMTSNLQDIGSGFGDMADGAESSSGRVILSNAELVKALSDDAQTLIDDYFDPIEQKYDLREQKAKTVAAIEEKNSAKTVKAQERAKKELTQALDDEGVALLKLAEKGKMTAKDHADYAKHIKQAYGKIPPVLQAMLDKLDAVNRAGQANVSVTVTPVKHTSRNPGPHRASGGPVTAGQPYTVGEEGVETFVPSSSGKILPHGAGGDTYILNVTGRLDMNEPALIRTVDRLRAISRRRAA